MCLIEFPQTNCVAIYILQGMKRGEVLAEVTPEAVRGGGGAQPSHFGSRATVNAVLLLEVEQPCSQLS